MERKTKVTKEDEKRKIKKRKEEILARELMDAADNKPSRFAIGKMQEIERIALSAR